MSKVLQEIQNVVLMDSTTNLHKPHYNQWRNEKYKDLKGNLCFIKKNKRVVFRWNPYRKDVCDEIDITKGIISSKIIKTVKDNCGLLIITTENSIYYFSHILPSKF